MKHLIYWICCAVLPSLAATKHTHDLRYLVEESAEAANSFLSLIPEDKRSEVSLEFDSDARHSGTETHETDSFCHVVGWCKKGWGVSMDQLNQEQLVSMHQLLNTILSPGGYQILVRTLNHQRIIGEMEEVSENQTLLDAVKNPKHAEGQLDTIFDLSPPKEGFYPMIAGGGHDLKNPVIKWPWDPMPNLKSRKKQFDSFSIAIYGSPGLAESWAVRFEGHHLTINVSFLRNPKTGQYTVRSTPLFVGTFPMIIPKTPFPKGDIAKQWSWQKGQLAMYSVAHHLHKFWLSAPQEIREKGFIPASHFPQQGPLVMDTPFPQMLSSMDKAVDLSKIREYPHIEVKASELNPESLWHLKQTFKYYTSLMHPEIEGHYYKRITNALRDNLPITLSWAGQDLTKVGSRHYSYIATGNLLLEFLQSNQYLVQHNPDVTGNHLHSMFRDLSFDWEDPLGEHEHNH